MFVSDSPWLLPNFLENVRAPYPNLSTSYEPLLVFPDFVGDYQCLSDSNIDCFNSSASYSSLGDEEADDARE